MKERRSPFEMHCATLLVLPFLFSSCVTTPPPSPESWPVPAEPVVRLQPGDTVSVKFAYWPELNQDQVVRPDGKIALQLVGDVTVEGLTPEGTRDQLLSLYGDKLKDPEISVIARDLDSRRIYVGGFVRTPGMYPIDGPLTALEAIMMAGGFIKQSSRMRQVVLVRQRDGKQYARAVNLRRSYEADQSDAVFLEPHDIVYVPAANIEKADQWVEQYINRIIPRSVSGTFGQTRVKTDRSAVDVPLSAASVRVTP